MSTTIDQKVVEMRFDNKQFESNVQTSLSTIDKLKQSLNLTGAAKGLENVGAAARNIDMSRISSAVDTIQSRFSTLGIVGVTALTNITNSAINTGKRMISALTIDPIKTGFSEYETQINAVQTILANTSSKGTTIKDVNKALDELNTYADKTIYNFTEMTRNIGTFTAAGIDLDTATSSIQGIANLAAVSGSTSQQASTAMYQLSQALSSGTVKLQDWNSVVNAGMGGQVFQDALKRTATVMGTNVDALIKKNGSFRESLKEGWITSEVLTKTLDQFTMCAEEGTKEWDEFKKSLKEEGYTDKQIEEILKMGKTATEAATKVKTFTQLWDTLKEAAQSGWTQSWEIVVGDFEEAKTLLTEISDTIGALIGKSAEARNTMLQGWKDLGGRASLIESLRNAFEGVMSIVTPIKEALTEIFPPITSEQLFNLTKGLENLTAKFKIGEQTASNIKRTFKGVFAILDIGVQAVKSLFGGFKSLFGIVAPAGDGLLSFTAKLGDGAVKFNEFIKSGDFFNKLMTKITSGLSTAVESIKKFATNISESLKKFFNIDTSGVDTFTDTVSRRFEPLAKVSDFVKNAFSSLGNIIDKITPAVKNLGSSIKEALGKAFDGFKNAFANAKFDSVLDLVNTGLFGGLVFGIKKIIDVISGIADGGGIISSVKDMVEKITGVFDGVKESLKAFQANLKADILLKIAGAIAILAASLFALSFIDSSKLTGSLVAITTLFADLFGAMYGFEKITSKSDLKSIKKMSSVMLTMSASVLILSVAMTKLAKLDWEGVGKGIVGVGGLTAILVIAAKELSKSSGKLVKGSAGLVIFTGAVLILAKAVSKMGEMSWETIGKGLVTMAGSLAAVTLAMNFLPKDMLSSSVGIVAVSGALIILSIALKSLGSMSWEAIGKGMAAMAGSLLAITVAMNFMSGSLAGAAAMVVIAGALALLVPVLKAFSEMSLTGIGKSLLVLAGAFTVIGVASLILGPLAPIMLALSAAIALLGVGCLAAGAGVLMFAGGLAALAASSKLTIAIVTDLIKAILLGLIGIIKDSVPAVINCLRTMLSAFLAFIVENVPKVVDSGMKLILGLLQGIADNIGKVVETAVDIVTNFIKGIANGLSKVIQAGIDLMIGFINGMANGIRNNTTSLIGAIENLMDAAIGAVKAWFVHAFKSGKDLIAKLISGVFDKKSDAKSAAKDIVSDMIKGVKEKFASFKQAGKDLIDGFKQGVKDKASGVVDAAKGVVSDALEGAKKLLGISSPSKKFIEVGKWSDMGIVVGLKTYANRVTNAAKDVGRGAVDSMRASLDGISAVINSNMNAEPTISPVLDLSRVESGMGYIGSMFSGKRTLSVNTDGAVQVSASMRRIQNGRDSNDVVSAIKDLRKELSDIPRNQYNVNGITYDDGSNVANLLSELVHAIKLDRRS